MPLIDVGRLARCGRGTATGDRSIDETEFSVIERNAVVAARIHSPHNSLRKKENK